ncbi:MDR family MFS transporter [Polyangium mundeleinium]|uniref:MDR family MFS transporter n=1 Tax=Polyangium mundeleinium TaxID=2995306 RepID=A0ABT5EX14_9BACT|nr:MDR family MFS transporter [Polyangium mundeleinium]MDC0746355.1 MDR family MFS transporter [Polyangium mundeleinium]
MSVPDERRTHRGLTVAGLVLALAMAALEATVVATAMPTVTGDLGGIEYYAWVTNAYLITSAISVPIFGKLADLHGRKPVLLAGIAIFLLGSAASGAAQSMPALIAFRAIQGLGAGAMQPMPVTIIGDIFGIEERSKLQGYIGAAWGFFGLVGPIIGGVIVENVSWRWVFYMNLPFGVAAAALVATALHERVERKTRRLDLAGALLLAGFVTSLLIASSGVHKSATFVLATPLLLGAFLFVERRAEEPLLPLALFARRVMALSSAIGAIIGGAMIALLTYVPLFIQGVLGGTPTQAGSSITPMLVSWPIASTFSGRILPRVGFRALVRFGMGCTAAAAVALPLVAEEGPIALRVVTGLFGIGMGCANTALVISVQTSVRWEQRGVATASTMFFRTIGGAVAVGVMGGVIVASLRKDPTLPSDAASRALSREGMSALGPDVVQRISGLLDAGLGTVFWMIAVLGVLAFVGALFFPDVPLATKAAEPAPAPAPPAH